MIKYVVVVVVVIVVVVVVVEVLLLALVVAVPIIYVKVFGCARHRINVYIDGSPFHILDWQC